MAAEDSYIAGLAASLRSLDMARLESWGRYLAVWLASGGRLLAAGNGGSAAQAQHLTAELVGRFCADRGPLSAVPLNADTAAVTAIANDFEFDEVYSRQVRAHGRPGDVLLVLSTSGKSPNLIRAVAAARLAGMRTWALTGPAPNPLASACNDFVAVEADCATAVQECHLVSVHLLCRALDESIAGTGPGRDRGSRGPGRQMRLVVVGDAVLDWDVSGDADRLSPEAPVPVVSSVSDRLAAGGAGRAAVLAAEAGYSVTLPHPRGPAPVAMARLVTPNDREARGLAPAVPGDGMAGDSARARHLRAVWEASGLAVTRGEHGAILVCGDEPPLAFPAPTVSAGDARGAGDMFAVTAAACLGQGLVLSKAMAEAVASASAYVALGDGHAPRKAPSAAGREGAVSLAARVRASGGVVVATGGCFDLLHRGHVSQLADARRLGDCLIVCLNSDASVRRLKGDGRPVVPAEDRATVLSALACVDAVIIFDEDTPSEMLRRIRPHVWVKGGDYAIADMPERAVVEDAGGTVVLVPYADGRSSTRLIQRAAAAYEGTDAPGD